MKPNEKRLIIEIDKNLHHLIKKAALEQKTTIKNWLMVAISEKMNNQRDGKYE